VGLAVLRLLLLFTTVPLVELALLLWIGARIGVLPTVALILGTGVAGASLARLQGLATWRRFQAALAAGRLPGSELLEGLLILVAGALLLTPGILTDAAGFLLLVPPARRWIVSRAEVRLRARVVTGGRPPGTGAAPRAPAEPEVIDAEFDVLDGPGRS
jgi:UPF0716 protein FxsA